MSSFESALLCSLDTFVFCTVLGLIGELSVSRSRIVLAFAAWDFVGSIVGLLAYPAADLLPMKVIVPIGWAAYFLAFAVLLLPRVRVGHRIYLIPVLLAVDNLIEALVGAPSTLAVAAEAALCSGSLAIIGLLIGPRIRPRIVSLLHKLMTRFVPSVISSEELS